MWPKSQWKMPPSRENQDDCRPYNFNMLPGHLSFIQLVIFLLACTFVSFFQSYRKQV